MLQLPYFYFSSASKPWVGFAICETQAVQLKQTPADVLRIPPANVVHYQVADVADVVDVVATDGKLFWLRSKSFLQKLNKVKTWRKTLKLPAADGSSKLSLVKATAVFSIDVEILNAKIKLNDDKNA